jgi:hypothetical protein
MESTLEIDDAVLDFACHGAHRRLLPHVAGGGGYEWCLCDICGGHGRQQELKIIFYLLS